MLHFVGLSGKYSKNGQSAVHPVFYFILAHNVGTNEVTPENQKNLFKQNI